MEVGKVSCIFESSNKTIRQFELTNKTRKMNWHDLGTKMVKTRKKHFCWGCGQHIEPGTTVRHNAGIIEGEGYFHTYYCTPCAAFMDSDHFDWEDHRDNGLGLQDLLCYDEYNDFVAQFNGTNKQ